MSKNSPVRRFKSKWMVICFRSGQLTLARDLIDALEFQPDNLFDAEHEQPCKEIRCLDKEKGIIHSSKT